MTVLSVNLNKIALLRNAREGARPSVVDAARVALAAGAQGITVHPRPDQRHIRTSDVFALADLLASEYPDIEFNIEGNPMAGPNAGGYPGLDALIEKTRPAQATLVPDSDNQLTSDHGWNLTTFNQDLADKIALYQSYGARVSLFMDPDIPQIQQAQLHGAERVELYTGPFADLYSEYGAENQSVQSSFQNYLAAARYANQIGLGVNAGHDLDLHNLTLFSQITEVAEVSIGHALICDALEMGLSASVSAYVKALA
ncbi:MAG: pyridoxine 5'-phosphate synthase [Pseudomonadaceae bacterium]|nr:pyridoxine 5'-phosphate synthase [Pseudomonadaceae bacterium]